MKVNDEFYNQHLLIQLTLACSKNPMPLLDNLMKRMTYGWTFTIKPKIHKDLQFLQSVIQIIESKISCFFCTIAKDNPKKLNNLENLKSKVSKYCDPNSLISLALSYSESLFHATIKLTWNKGTLKWRACSCPKL